MAYGDTDPHGIYRKQYYVNIRPSEKSGGSFNATVPASKVEREKCRRGKKYNKIHGFGIDCVRILCII